MCNETLNTMTRFFSASETDTTKAPPARLFVVSGPLTGAHFQLTSESVGIGRSARNAICIPSRGVSKSHCKIMHQAGGPFFVLDEGSTNGTKVNRRPLEFNRRLQLSHGDTITVFDSTFLFLNPQHTFRMADERMHVDKDSAEKEAACMLKKCPDIIALCKHRRKKRA